MAPRLKLSKASTTPTVDLIAYRSIVGSLRYLVNTMPDLAFSVGVHQQVHGEPHHRALRRCEEGVALHRWHTGLCEAEYIAGTTAAYQGIWLVRLLLELKDKEEHAINIHINNQSTIELSKNPVFHDRSKHIH
jgi:hypothetical protein